jgi:hypothetical protein
MHTGMLRTFAFFRGTETVRLQDLSGSDDTEIDFIGSNEHCLHGVKEGFSASKGNEQLVDCVRMSDTTCCCHSYAELGAQLF